MGADALPIAAFAGYSRLAPSTRVRLHDWFDHLGVEAEMHSYAGLANAAPSTLVRNAPRVLRAEQDLRRFLPGARTVIVSREASPLSRGGVEERLLGGASHSVFDFDDAIYLATSTSRRVQGAPRKFERCVRSASAVVAGNDRLAEAAARYSHEVIVIPSCVEPGDYQPLVDWELSDRPMLVWLGSASTEQYLVPLLPALDRLHDRYGVCLTVISAGTPNPALGGRSWIRTVRWTPDGFASLLASADIALAPLIDTEFARGKCAYKLLQYAASGLPMVGSPVGANRVALERFGGIAVERADDWYDAVAALIDAPSGERARVAQQGLEAVRRWYSFAAWAPQWRAVTGLDGDGGRSA